MEDSSLLSGNERHSVLFRRRLKSDLDKTLDSGRNVFLIFHREAIKNERLGHRYESNIRENAPQGPPNPFVDTDDTLIDLSAQKHQRK